MSKFQNIKVLTFSQVLSYNEQDSECDRLSWVGSQEICIDKLVSYRQEMLLKMQTNSSPLTNIMLSLSYNVIPFLPTLTVLPHQ